MPTANGLHWRIDDIRAPWANGAPILFNHGIGTDHGIWSDWLPVLGSAHQLIRFDLRGFGRSTVPAGHRWSLDGLVDDLLAVADAAGLDRFHAVGESIGGTAAIAAGLRAPDRILSVICSNGAHKGTGLGRVPGWRATIERDGLGPWADDMLDRRFAPGAVPAAVRAWFDGAQRKGGADAVVGLGELLLATDMSAQLPSLKPPLLILAPQESPFLAADVFEDMHRLVPGARIHRFPGARHGLPLSHGRLCATLVRDFLATI
jgi:3-oxoadipate enol-lactonase